MLKTKVNNLDQKILDAATVIQINQYITDKENLKQKKLKMLIKNTRHKWFIYCDCFEYKNY